MRNLVNIAALMCAVYGCGDSSGNGSKDMQTEGSNAISKLNIKCFQDGGQNVAFVSNGRAYSPFHIKMTEVYEDGHKTEFKFHDQKGAVLRFVNNDDGNTLWFHIDRESSVFNIFYSNGIAPLRGKCEVSGRKF